MSHTTLNLVSNCLWRSIKWCCLPSVDENLLHSFLLFPCSFWNLLLLKCFLLGLLSPTDADKVENSEIKIKSKKHQSRYLTLTYNPNQALDNYEKKKSYPYFKDCIAKIEVLQYSHFTGPHFVVNITISTDFFFYL